MDPARIRGFAYDRVYGRAIQYTDLTSGGEKITNDPLVDQLTQKLNEIYKGNGVASDGKPTSVVDTEIQDQE